MSDSYRVNITERALADLEAIFKWISLESPGRASRVVERILNAIDDLEFMPGRFRRARRSRKHGHVMHSRLVRPYIIYFRIDEPGRVVFIVEVRHGARRQPRSFE